MAVTAMVPRASAVAKRLPLRPQQSFLKPLSVALLGFGNVGCAVAKILCKGLHPELRLTHVFNRNLDRKRQPWVPDNVTWTDKFGEVLAGNADVVVELMGGFDPAYECIRRALLSGKSVVTANKHVIAKYGLELSQLAHEVGQHLLYGASVGGAIPILPAVQHGLAGDRLVRVVGVLNGTCNFILSKMEAKGSTLAAALAEAQTLGYAECDPTDDITGVDAACKLSILVRVGLGSALDACQVPRESIERVRPVDFVYARQMGCTVRQISYAESTGNALITSVGPALVPLTSTFARTVDNQNAVQLTGENSGTTVLGGVGAGGAATAVAVVSDLLTLCNSMPQVPGPAVLRRYSQAELATRHYIRFSGKSNGQLMARARRRLADHGIAVEQRLDTPAEYKGHNALVVGRCTSRALHRAFSEPKQVRENAFSMPLLM